MRITIQIFPSHGTNGIYPCPVYFIFDPFFCSRGINVAIDSSTFLNNKEPYYTLLHHSRESKKNPIQCCNVCYLLIEQNNFDGDHNCSNEGDGYHWDKNSNVIMKFLEKETLNCQALAPKPLAPNPLVPNPKPRGLGLTLNCSRPPPPPTHHHNNKTQIVRTS